MALTTKQRVFVEAYLSNGFNATQAAITAGYSRKTANEIGAQNLAKVSIRAHIEARIAEIAMSANEALVRLSEHARGDLGDFIGLSPEELARHPQSRLLKKVKVTTRTAGTRDDPYTEERVELELYDAQAALVQILKEQHLRAGEATERSETRDVTFDDDERVSRLTALLNAARDRRDRQATGDSA